MSKENINSICVTISNDVDCNAKALESWKNVCETFYKNNGEFLQKTINFVLENRLGQQTDEIKTIDRKTSVNHPTICFSSKDIQNIISKGGATLNVILRKILNLFQVLSGLNAIIVSFETENLGV
jgi:hypothetical protein